MFADIAVLKRFSHQRQGGQPYISVWYQLVEKNLINPFFKKTSKMWWSYHDYDIIHGKMAIIPGSSHKSWQSCNETWSLCRYHAMNMPKFSYDHNLTMACWPSFLKPISLNEIGILSPLKLKLPIFSNTKRPPSIWVAKCWKTSLFEGKIPLQTVEKSQKGVQNSSVFPSFLFSRSLFLPLLWNEREN